MRILRTALLAAAGGVVIAVVLFWMTAPNKVYFCPVNCVTTQVGHSNFWTGEITPQIRSQYALDGSGRVTSVYELPEDWKSYRIIPLPVGFVVGSLLTLTVITIVSRRPSGIAPSPAEPAA